MPDPLVSIIITTYQPNKEFLEEAIQSVYNQVYSNIELVLVDDGSTPSAEYILDSSVRSGVQYHYLDHQGLPWGLIAGVQQSHGKYFAVLDHDDRLSNKKSISARVEALERTGAGLAHGNINYIDEAGKVYANKQYQQWDNGKDLFKAFMGNIMGPMQHGSILFNRDRVLQEGSYDKDKQEWFDTELTLQVAMNHGSVFVDETVMDYRTHANNTSSSPEYRLKELKHKFTMINQVAESYQERFLLKSRSLAVTLAKASCVFIMDTVIPKKKVMSYMSTRSKEPRFVSRLSWQD